MNSSNGQSSGTNEKRSGSAHTRQRLLAAAAELIAELGWGQVTTRAVAERAGLPHGAVSYHFRGKQEMLTEAALQTVERLFPISDLEAVESLETLISLIEASVGNRDAISSVSIGVLMEAMRESKRNTALRQRLATLLRDYRHVVTRLVRAEQQRGALPPDPALSGLAMLIAAIGDGLLLHVLLDPNLDITEAIATLRVLLRQEAETKEGASDEQTR